MLYNFHQDAVVIIVSLTVTAHYKLYEIWKAVNVALTWFVNVTVHSDNLIYRNVTSALENEGCGHGELEEHPWPATMGGF